MKLSPSGLDSLSICSCFEYIQSDDPEGAREDGLACHKACETGDLDGLTEEQRGVVTNALIYRDGILASHPEGTLRASMKEKKVRIPIVHANGIIDELLLFSGEGEEDFATIIDWKFGRRGAKEAENNLQAFAYVLGVWDLFPNVREVQCHIVNARTLEPVVPFLFDRDVNKEAMEKRIQAVVAAAEDPFKRPTAVDSDLCCRCANAQRCPAFSATVQAVVPYAAEPGMLPSVFQLSAVATPEDHSRVQQVAVMLETWAKEAKKMNTEFMKNGGDIPGYRLVTRAGSRSIDQVPDAVQRLRDTGTLATFDVINACKLSFTALADQIAAIHKCTKKAAQERLAAVLGTLVSESPTITYLQRCKAKGGDDAVLIE